MSQDPELLAMRAITRTLERLPNQNARYRVLQYAGDKVREMNPDIRLTAHKDGPAVDSAKGADLQPYANGAQQDPQSFQPHT